MTDHRHMPRLRSGDLVKLEVRVPAETRERLLEDARRRGLTLSQVLREAIESRLSAPPSR